MATGDVYTQAAGAPIWDTPATVIGANGPVLTDETAVPVWAAASDAVAGGWSVLTISHNRPAWMPISAASASCFPYGANIALIVGGMIGDSGGTLPGGAIQEAISAPGPMAINPADGLLYFCTADDAYFRMLDMDTGIVTTSTRSYSYNHNTPTAMAIVDDGAGGTIFTLGQDDNDEYISRFEQNTAALGYSANIVASDFGPIPVIMPDASTKHVYLLNDPDQIGGLAATADGTGIYISFPYNPSTNYSTNFGLQGCVVLYTIATGVYTFVAGAIELDGSSGYPSPAFGGSISDTGTTDQGEGAAGVDSLLGNVINVRNTTGEVLYTISDDVYMARKIAADRTVTSLSNHTAVRFGGDSGGDVIDTYEGGYHGDGIAAYTPDGYIPFGNTGQFNQPKDIAVSDCGDVIVADFGNDRVRIIDPSGVLNTLAGTGIDTGDYTAWPTTTPVSATSKNLVPNSLCYVSGKGLYISQGDGAGGADGDTPDAIYLLTPDETLFCLSLTPTIRLVAGGGTPDDADDQTDGAVGTAVLEGINQMCWGPDGKIWIAAQGLYVRTYDPATGLVATTPFAPQFGGRRQLLGICCSKAGTVYILSQSTDDEDTCKISKIPFGATSGSDVTDIFFFSEFAGSASNLRNLGVMSNEAGEEFVFAGMVSYALVTMYDTTTDTPQYAFMSDTSKGNPDASDPTTWDMGEDVDGLAGSLGDVVVGFTVTPTGEAITGSISNDVVRSATIDFEDDGTGHFVPVAHHLHSVTNHKLIGDSDVFGGDGDPAYTAGNYDAQFFGVMAVERDACGNYFIMDQGYGRIRFVSADGILHTIAGDGTSGYDMGDVFPTTTPVLATTVSMGLGGGGSGTYGAFLADPAGGTYVGFGQNCALQGLCKLEG